MYFKEGKNEEDKSVEAGKKKNREQNKTKYSGKKSTLRLKTGQSL